MTARSAKPPTARRASGRPAPVRPPRRLGTPRGPSGPQRFFERAKRTWDRPLTAYYLILGGSLLITALGLVMVTSQAFLYNGLSTTFPLILSSFYGLQPDRVGLYLVPLALGNFLAADDSPWELLMTTGLLYALPPAAIYYIFKRYMVSGLTAGAVKS